MIQPAQVYPNEGVAREEVLLALRVLFSSRPEATQEGPEALAELLHTGCFLTYRPTTFAVEAALEVLQLDSGEVAA